MSPVLLEHKLPTGQTLRVGQADLMRGRTSFVIAHRLSTIKRADRILVIENGRIAEMGNHLDLIRARGHYYDLYTKQFHREAEQRFTELVEPEVVAV